MKKTESMVCFPNPIVDQEIPQKEIANDGKIGRKFTHI